MDYALEVEGLSKTYRKRKGFKVRETPALENVSLRVRPGEFVGLLGPNGAGKTTLLKILCTLLLPDGGSARLNGFDVLKQSEEVRRSIGWLHGETGGRALYWRLTARDNLRFYAYLQDVPPRVARERIDTLLDFFGLRGDADRQVLKFSTGMKVKLMLARALLHNPPVLLMDEPTVGLDVRMARETRDLLRSLSAELQKTILFTSHNLTEVEKLCPRVAILHRGRLIADDTTPNLAARLKTREIVEVKAMDAWRPAEVHRLQRLPSVKSVEADGENTLALEVDEAPQAILELAQALGTMGVRVQHIAQREPRLEDVFLHLTGEPTTATKPPTPETAPRETPE
ncbi:MAG: ABC transporter ATP-binding protein [Euryarchaeota archaeon]|nr:ABC transporter ATP-binding protein [Euryarchaeota archaeon]